MQIQVSGQHISLGESLSNHSQEKLNHLCAKYFEKAVYGHVHFAKESYLYNCDIIVNEGIGRHTIVKSSAKANEIYSSLEQALMKMERQLRKHKTIIKDHHKSKMAIAYLEKTNEHQGHYDSVEQIVYDNSEFSSDAIIANSARTNIGNSNHVIRHNKPSFKISNSSEFDLRRVNTNSLIINSKQNITNNRITA